MPASLRTVSTGCIVPLNALELSSSNLARVMVAVKSSPSKRESISTEVEVALDRVRLARSQDVRRRRRARASPDKSERRLAWRGYLVLVLRLTFLRLFLEFFHEVLEKVGVEILTCHQISSRHV